MAETTKKKDIWEELRKPFDEKQIGKLPKVSCYNCTKATKTAQSALDKHCPAHKMIRCEVCQAFITEGHIHLDYVGHAITTDRILKVDPEFTWSPFAVGDDGLPALDREGNLWINLTIGGVTRPGVGDGANAKERIGDALRNAAMRFGVAIDLWMKEEAEKPDEGNTLPETQTKKSETVKEVEKVSVGETPISETSKTKLRIAFTNANILHEEVTTYCQMMIGKEKPTTEEDATVLLEQLAMGAE